MQSLLLKSEGNVSVSSTTSLVLDSGLSMTLKATNSMAMSCPGGVTVNGSMIKLG